MGRSRLKDVLASVTSKIDTLSSQAQIYHQTDVEDVYADNIYALSQLKISELSAIIQTLIHENQERLPPEEIQKRLQPLVAFVNDYANLVADTPLNFTHLTWHSNRVIRELAIVLGKAFDKPAIGYLFPKLVLNDAVKQIKLGELNAYVVSDDNTALINVRDCLDKAAAEFCTTPASVPVVLRRTDSTAALTPDEAWRVQKHTKEATEYMHAIEARKPQEELTAASHVYHQKLLLAELFRGYADAGRKKLMAGLQQGIVDRATLIAALMKFKNKEDRDILLDSFIKDKNPEALFQLVLNGSKTFDRNVFTAILQNPDHYHWDKSLHDECTAYLMLFTYQAYTASRPHQREGYTSSLFGAIFGNYDSYKLTGVPKDEKEAGAEAMLKRMRESKLENYDRKNKSTAFAPVKAAVDDGLLKKIDEQISLISRPENRPTQAVRKGWFG